MADEPVKQYQTAGQVMHELITRLPAGTLALRKTRTGFEYEWRYRCDGLKMTDVADVTFAEINAVESPQEFAMPILFRFKSGAPAGEIADE
jgi:hypothetical protein